MNKFTKLPASPANPAKQHALARSSASTTERHLLNGHSGGLIWFTGLSGSGKSTLAHAVEEKTAQPLRETHFFPL